MSSKTVTKHKKSNSYELDFFICADRHNIVCGGSLCEPCTRNII